MVGFGSSLRMGRRTGWEAAYLDYESLKLLLSQAASVYEQHGANTTGGGGGGDSTAKRDFRDELFLESDSDKAFASSVHAEDDDDDDDSSLDSGKEHGRGHDVLLDPFPTIADPLHHQFPFSYSTQGNLFSSTSGGKDSDDESEAGYDDTCGNVVYNPWSRSSGGATASSSSSMMTPGTKKHKPEGGGDKKSRRRQRKQQLQLRHQQQLLSDDNFYPSQSAIPETFIVENINQDESGDDGDEEGGGSRKVGDYNNDGDLYGGGYTSLSSSMPQSERKSLLPPSTSKRGVGRRRRSNHHYPTSDHQDVASSPSLVASQQQQKPSSSWAFAFTPNKGKVPPEEQHSNYGSVWSKFGSPFDARTVTRDAAAAAARQPVSSKKAIKDKERKRAWRQRRKRQLVKRRKEQERKVPTHIRLAHSKARSITERFLGLLRAEVEKVTLFAQTRLGELSETAGSLRFLSSEELTGLATDASATFDYPFSDGGMHPSASSSSDEGVGVGFSWSDSSTDDDMHSKHKVEDYTLTRPFFSRNGSQRVAATENEPNARIPFSEIQEKLEASRRKIAHYQEVRRTRPIFQRNDYIVGDDLLLVSAVDEADAFTSVAVELLHILKYISLNTLAVRKICKKHDRLSMNRMLGGYYQRTRAIGELEEGTLGGLLSGIPGGSYEAHPSHIARSNHGKLMGVLDVRLQQLANSRTVKAVSSCLALALSEYEVSHFRADALAKAKPPNDRQYVSDIGSNTGGNGPFSQKESTPLSDDEQSNGPPSTTSSLSLGRLQYSVLSIAALREAMRVKRDFFSTYVGRAHMSLTGHAVPGEGLDGSSRECLDLLLSFNPDSALLLSSLSIHAGLNEGQWTKGSLASCMQSSLAVGMSLPSNAQNKGLLQVSMSGMRARESQISRTIGLLPNTQDFVGLSCIGIKIAPSDCANIAQYINFPSGVLQANRLCCFLYAANYFVAHPTAITSALFVGSKYAFTAMFIGIPIVGAIVVTLAHCWLIMGRLDDQTISAGSLTRCMVLLLLSSLSGIAGNVVQAYGFWNLSLPLMLFGRMFIGVACPEIIHRQFVMQFIPSSLVVAEGTLLVQFQAFGQLFGLLVGSLSDRYGHDPSTVNLIMVILWAALTCYICVGLHQLSRFGQFQSQSHFDFEDEKDLVDEDSSISVGSEQDIDPGRLFQQNHANNGDDLGYQGSNLATADGDVGNAGNTKAKGLLHCRHLRLRSHAKRVRKLLAYSFAVPVTMAMIAFTVFSQEVLFSSCPLITNRYFSWEGNVSGLLLCALTVLVLPLDVFCEQMTRRYEERRVLRRGVVFLVGGLVIMVNWGSLFALIPKVRNLFQESEAERHHQYDWFVGVFQYPIGFTLCFASLHSLEIASRSLLGKVSPVSSGGRSWNNDFVFVVVTFVRLFAQLFANCQITMVVLSHRVINTDIVNALIIPMLIAGIVAAFFVRKHFFFLM